MESKVDRHSFCVTVDSCCVSVFGQKVMSFRDVAQLLEVLGTRERGDRSESRSRDSLGTALGQPLQASTLGRVDFVATREFGRSGERAVRQHLQWTGQVTMALQMIPTANGISMVLKTVNSSGVPFIKLSKQY